MFIILNNINIIIIHWYLNILLEKKHLEDINLRYKFWYSENNHFLLFQVKCFICSEIPTRRSQKRIYIGRHTENSTMTNWENVISWEIIHLNVWNLLPGMNQRHWVNEVYFARFLFYCANNTASNWSLSINIIY